jgi:PAS domain S-box-containing protein
MADPSGTITYVNDKFVNISGYSREELLGNNHRIVKSTVQSAAFWRTMWQTISAGRVWQGVVCNRNKSGALYWVQTQISPFFDANGSIEHYVSIRTDITEHVRQQAELTLAQELVLTHAALRQREWCQRATLDNLPFLFWLKDALGHYVAVNQAFAESCKRASPADVVGLTDLDLWHAPLAEFNRKIDTKVMQSGQPQEREDRHKVAGQLRWFEIFIKPLLLPSGEVGGTVGYARDITERKEAALLLQEKTELLNAIFDFSPDAYVSFDAQHRVHAASPAFTRMTGLRQEQLTGLNESHFASLLARICTAEAPFSGIQALRRQESDAPQRFELALAGKRVLEARLYSAQNRAVSQILHFRDVTNETEVEKIKCQFITNAAHELRTPMVSIYGYAELLKSETISQASFQESLDVILKQSELMVSILNDWLDLARIDSRRGKDFVFESIQLHQLVAKLIQDFKPPVGRSAPTLNTSDLALSIMADSKRVRQAILNVLTNAYKYSSFEGAVQIGLKSHEKGIAVCVTDQGIGMTPAQLKRVGERFYRADMSGKISGTGLGISIVNEIMLLHRGSVEIASEPGCGTCVSLIFAHEIAIG